MGLKIVRFKYSWSLSSFCLPYGLETLRIRDVYILVLFILTVSAQQSLFKWQNQQKQQNNIIHFFFNWEVQNNLGFRNNTSYQKLSIKIAIFLLRKVEESGTRKSEKQERRLFTFKWLLKSRKKQGLWWCNMHAVVSRFWVLSCIWKGFLLQQINGPRQTEFMIWKQITTGCYTGLLHHQAGICAPASTKLHWSTRNSCLPSFMSFWISAAAFP